MIKASCPPASCLPHVPVFFQMRFRVPLKRHRRKGKATVICGTEAVERDVFCRLHKQIANFRPVFQFLDSARQSHQEHALPRPDIFTDRFQVQTLCPFHRHILGRNYLHLTGKRVVTDQNTGYRRCEWNVMVAAGAGMYSRFDSLFVRESAQHLVIQVDKLFQKTFTRIQFQGETGFGEVDLHIGRHLRSRAFTNIGFRLIEQVGDKLALRITIDARRRVATGSSADEITACFHRQCRMLSALPGGNPPRKLR